MKKQFPQLEKLRNELIQKKDKTVLEYRQWEVLQHLFLLLDCISAFETGSRELDKSYDVGMIPGYAEDLADKSKALLEYMKEQKETE